MVEDLRKGTVSVGFTIGDHNHYNLDFEQRFLIIGNADLGQLEKYRAKIQVRIYAYCLVLVVIVAHPVAA